MISILSTPDILVVDTKSIGIKMMVISQCRGTKVKAECVYPWGSSYSEHLTEFLDQQGIAYCEDPRTDGGDSYGFLLSKNETALQNMESKLQELMDKIDEDPDNQDDIWEEAWNLSNEEVQEISTDWKHLEIYDHPEELAKVGVHLEIHFENHDPPYLIAFSLIE